MIQIRANLYNQLNQNEITLTTNGNEHTISIPSKASGYGSSANGGELLFLALAACYGNDIYREAAKRQITIKNIYVEVNGSFDETPGSVASDVTYRATVEAEASEEEILELMKHTDTVAEIHNTLRQGIQVRLEKCEAVSVTK